MTPTDKPMTVDALMDMAFDLEIAARDYHCAPDKYLQQELIDARAALRAAIGQYGDQREAAGRGSGEILDGRNPNPPECDPRA